MLKKLIEMDEDVRTLGLIGSFITTELFIFIFYYGWLMFLPLDFPSINVLYKS